MLNFIDRLNMSNLDIAIDLATQRHAGQKDKAGQDYIQHPLRVMNAVDTQDAKIVAILHDILEDTETTAHELNSLGFATHIVDAIQALTKQAGETRLQAAERTALNPLAVKVKLADLMDNMDASRLTQITEKDVDRMEQYKLVMSRLLAAQNS